MGRKIRNWHIKAWDGVSILVVSQEAAGEPHRIRINFYVLFFSTALVLSLPLAAAGVYLHQEFIKQEPDVLFKNRMTLLNTLSLARVEKENQLSRLNKQLLDFQKVSAPREAALLRRYTKEKIKIMEERVTPALDPREQNIFRMRQLIRRFRILNETSYHSLNLVWNRLDLHFLMPRNRPLAPGVGRITSSYGGRRNPFGLLSIVAGKEFHSGYDFGAPIGTPIYSTGPGTVIKVVSKDSGEGYGRFVQVHHGLGYTTLYAHCSQVMVEEGDRINRGDIVAKVGASGRTTGAHLHYEVGMGNKPRGIDPWLFMKLN